MSIVPGSHAQGFVPHNLSDPKYPYLDPERYDPNDEIMLEMQAGDGILFSPFLFHASRENTGDRIKFVMAVHIQDGAALVDPDDPNDPVVKMMHIHQQRSVARSD